MINDVIWINPVVRGSCDPFGSCGVGCCRIRIYEPNNVDYELKWCEHFDESARRCKIYETRPEGCRTYPEVRHIQRDIWHFPGCGYYLEEANVNNK